MSFPDVGDQGKQGSCVGWAVGYAARAYYAQSHEGRSVADAANIPSPAYIYNSLVGSDDCGTGTRIPAALELLKTGSVSARDLPYSEAKCAAPTADLVRRATDFRIDGWAMVDFRSSLDQVKGALVQGNPVVVGLVPDDDLNELQGPAVWRSGAPGEITEGHAVTVVGYDDRLGTFRFINSWGTDWGDDGYGLMAYQTFSDRVREAYVMTVPEGLQPVPRPRPKPVDPVPPTPEPPAPEPEPVPVDIELPAGLECSSVSLAADPSALIGFVSTPDDLERIEAVAGSNGIANRVALRPWPQCEVLLTLADQMAESDAPVLDVDRTQYREGEQLVVGVETPRFDGYVHVAYIQADGSVATLEQVSPTSLVTHAPGSRLLFGDGKDGRASFTIGAPFGNEMLVVLASKSPLFSEPRPQVESEREFLTALRLALLRKASSTDPNRFVSATAFPIVTTGEGGKAPCVERALAC